MELWPAEYEALRDEARRAVRETMGLLRGEPGTPPEDRAERVRQQREWMKRLYSPVPEAVERRIAGVPCRVFRPQGAARGVFLHFHGGGMMVGAPELNDAANLDLCRRLGVAVVSASYRLAPEHPFPAGPDDGLAVAAWLVAHAEDEFGSSRLLVGGESAGGYMAAITLLRVRDQLRAAHRFAAANLVFGVYDWGRSPSQRGIRPVDAPDWLDPDGIRFFTDCFLPGMSDDQRRDPAVSPAYADLRGLPPAIMTVGTSDHLLDDTLLLAVRWRAAGNAVELAVFPDCPHGFTAFPCELARRASARINGFLERALDNSID